MIVTSVPYDSLFIEKHSKIGVDMSTNRTNSENEIKHRIIGY